MKKKIIWLGAALLTAGTASAQISVVNTQSANFGPTAGGAFSISYQVQNPSDVIVAAFYVDAGGGALTSLSFGTGVGNQAADGLTTLDRSSLGYFLNPSTSSGLSLQGTFGAADGSSAGYFLWELSGVDLAGSIASASGSDNTTSITTSTANSFITDFLGVNDFGISSIAPTSGATQTEVGSGLFVVPGGGWVVPGQATAGTPGTYQLGWDVAGGYGNYGEVAYAFTPAAVPEPSSMALVGAGIMLLGVLRRFKAK